MTEETKDTKPSRIVVRSNDHQDLHFLELREFYRNKQLTDKTLEVEYKLEKSEETQSHIQIDFYNKDNEPLDALMIPYKV